MEWDLFNLLTEPSQPHQIIRTYLFDDSLLALTSTNRCKYIPLNLRLVPHSAYLFISFNCKTIPNQQVFQHVLSLVDLSSCL